MSNTGRPDSRSRLPSRRPQPEEMKTSRYIYGVEVLDGNDAWQLFEASADGNVAQAEQLLAKDPRLANAQYDYQFPIHEAVEAGHTRIVRLLLENGADPGQSRYTYNSWDRLLKSAQDRGDQEIESLLLTAMRRRFPYTPEFDQLSQAIIQRDVSEIRVLLAQQPELAGCTDALGNNAVHWCVITRQLNMIRLFVDAGTPVDAQRADGQTPVLLAVSGANDYWYRETRDRSHPSLRNHWVLAGCLLAHGADYTFSVAAAVGDQQHLEYLLKENPDLARQLDSARVSPLSRAARSGYRHIVQLLLDRGADPNQPEDCATDGRALYDACCGNHLDVAHLLLKHGARPNAEVDSCECCLTIAGRYHGDRAKPLQELLTQYGAVPPQYAL